jgi:hypothetical protein
MTTANEPIDALKAKISNLETVAQDRLDSLTEHQEWLEESRTQSRHKSQVIQEQRLHIKSLKRSQEIMGDAIYALKQLIEYL